MPANFYNNKAAMVGMDRHPARFLTGTAKDYIGGEKKPWYYFVAVPFWWPGGADEKRTSTVTADGEKMIRDPFTVGAVPHVPAPAPFHPLQALTNGSIVKDSKSRPFLSTTRVTSQGDPLATCILGPVGADMNCQEVDGGKPEALTGLVISGCTVMTQPTVKDFVFRIFDEFIKEWLAEKIVSLLDLVLKYFKIGAIPRAIVSWVAKKVVPKLINWAEDVAKNVWDQIERASDRCRRKARQSPVLTS
ncbi:hypothetical protein WMF37_21405 [Sorangium sp. So ce291]|uniref:hypothetical protein n=1 Tax=Sorangium sp. So ce291 TaxID=3133294 RepID=UPI003F5E3F05